MPTIFNPFAKVCTMAQAEALAAVDVKQLRLNGTRASLLASFLPQQGFHIQIGQGFYVHIGRAQYKNLDAPILVQDVPPDVTLLSRRRRPSQRWT